MKIGNREFFGLQEACTGELVHLKECSYDGCDSYELTRDTNHPLFEAKSLSQLSRVLMEATPAYNTDRECPGWGPFTAEQLRPIKARGTVVLEPLELPLVRRVRTVDTRSITLGVAFGHAGGKFELVTLHKYVVFWLVTLRSEQSFAEVKAWEGEQVYGGDKSVKRHVYKVVPVPEEYVGLLKGQPGALLIASEMVT